MSDEQQWTGKVEQWGIFELSLEGPEDANPFLDVRLSARFRHGNRVVWPDGFYDGGGTYRVRFMPDTLGAWSFETRSNRDELDGVTGEFVCTEPSPDNHGPVRVHDKHHFSYADGIPHVPVGTTCYVWTHQGDELEEETLNTLRHAPFNKLRMCVFPKHYAYNENEPPAYPFERAEGGGWDFERFDPGFFRRLEGRVGDLMELGIEADVILFHPYDRWGFATMPAEVDDRYLRYIVARLGAYRNVWWSMANEYDLMREKSTADWDRFFRVVQESDPYQHLRSVHNWHEFYDHGKPWVTHQSIQHSDLGKTDEWRELYRKPVVVDECCYEGNIAQHWGNISAREMVHRFWEGTVRGGYVGHGETYTHPEDVLWWSKGGVLHGQSPERIAFPRKVLDRSPVESLDPLAPPTSTSAERYPCGGKENDYYLFYFGRHQPAALTLALPEGSRYRGEIVDTWGMKTTPIREVMEGKCTIELPGRPYFALQVSRLQEDGSDSESGVERAFRSRLRKPDLPVSDEEDGGLTPDEAAAYNGAEFPLSREEADAFKGVFGASRGRLDRLSEKLAQRYGWYKLQARRFVLTGEAPLPLRVAVYSVPSTEVRPDVPGTSRVIITADAWVYPEEVAVAFRTAQRQILGGDVREFSDKVLEVGRFVSRQTRLDQARPS